MAHPKPSHSPVEVEVEMEAKKDAVPKEEDDNDAGETDPAFCCWLCHGGVGGGPSGGGSGVPCHPRLHPGGGQQPLPPLVGGGDRRDVHRSGTGGGGAGVAAGDHLPEA